jgi:membrane-bound lytic murein transglycosylase B
MELRMRAPLKLSFTLVGLLMFGAASAEFAERAEVKAYIDELASGHGFEPATLERWFAGTERQQGIIDAISRPAERVLEWHEYRQIFIQDSRIAQGVEFWQQNAADLARAERVYGVPASVIVAIIGVETRFGQNKGRWRVMDALATLAFDYPPRSAFFRRELTEFLLLAREEDKDPLTLVGSYAGAMGYGQFIPSSYRAYAVDFDGDGRRDIWTNRADAIGSVANYLRVHGWVADASVAKQVAVRGDGAEALVSNGLQLNQTVGGIRRAGVELDGAARLPDDTGAVLVRMQGADAPEYWLGLRNFYVITRYNRSSMYALAVYQLSAEIERAYRQSANIGAAQ